MTTRVLALLLFVACALPASALADSTVPPPPAGQPGIFAQGEPKAGFGQFEVDADCEKPAQQGDTDCTTTLQVVMNGKVVDSRVVTIPLDGDDVVYDVDTSAIRDQALVSGAKIKTLVKAYSADGSVFISQEGRTDSPYAGWNKRTAWDCLHKRVLVSNGTVTSKPGQFTPAMQLHNVVPTYANFTTGDAGVVVHFHGLVYSVMPRTTARFDCVAFNTSGGQILVPMVFITKGIVWVEGKPVKQIATALVTPEATFRSLNREAVKYVVERDTKYRHSTMQVLRGRTMQATHISGVSANFPCKSGKKITVGPHGPIN